MLERKNASLFQHFCCNETQCKAQLNDKNHIVKLSFLAKHNKTGPLEAFAILLARTKQPSRHEGNGERVREDCWETISASDGLLPREPGQFASERCSCLDTSFSVAFPSLALSLSTFAPSCNGRQDLAENCWTSHVEEIAR